MEITADKRCSFRLQSRRERDQPKIVSWRSVNPEERSSAFGEGSIALAIEPATPVAARCDPQFSHHLGFSVSFLLHY
jgi:hypothetical protein